MKKKIILFSSLFVLLGVLTGGVLFFSRQTDGGNTPQEVLEPSGPDEDLNQFGLSKSADISLDFTKKTNGRWAYQVDFDSQEPDSWQDQVYNDSYVVNADMVMLVPPAGSAEILSGWNADHSVYISPSENIQLYATGLEPGTIYRVALFIPRTENDVGTNTIVYYSTAVCQQKDESTLVCSADISCYSGLYKDLTLVISGNGEYYTHTFNVQIQNVSQELIDDRSFGFLSGLYYDTYRDVSAAYVRKDGPVDSSSFSTPSSGIAISAPLDNDVYTGYDNASILECIISLDRSYNWDEIWLFEVSFHLTEQETGQDVWQRTNYAKLHNSGESSWLTVNIPFSEVDEGEYSLSAEVIRSVWNDEEHNYVDAVSLGADTVNFSVEKEIDPSELYAQYIHDGLNFDLYNDENYYWNRDYTHLTIFPPAYDFQFVLNGMRYGEVYRCALIQETGSNGKVNVTPIPLTTVGPYGDIRVDLSNILPRYGNFGDITLLAYGGGECITHTFDGEVGWYEESEYGGMANIPAKASARDLFVCRSQYPDDLPQPETGYTVCIPEGAILSGYVGNELHVPIAFSPEYSGYAMVSLRLTEKDTGTVIGESTLTVSIEEQSAQPPLLVVGRDFIPGEYILLVSVDGQPTELQIMLEKEQTPRDVYAEYKATTGIPEELSEQGVTIYENPEASIIPEIKDYLASMERFDTDMFNQFLRYRYAANQSMISSFAMTSPNVPESQQSIDREDLLFTANWLLRDLHGFQTEDMKHYSDAQIIDLDSMNAFFGDVWKELMAMDYAAGFAMDSDGTYYFWLPVYYEDAQGGLANGNLYLFVYILYQGADTDYLDATNFYNPEFYNDYHTTQLLITDQQVVANMLNKLIRTKNTLFMPNSNPDYPTLSPGDEGEYVRRMQRRLQRLGYLTTSVDAVYTPSVAEAVKAWQADMGLQESRAVTPEMQCILHDNTPYRQMLVAWLNSHSE